MAKHLFFETSRQTSKQVTELFDFLWPTAAAMWNLRWQVEGYLRIRPDATVGELENRFVLGSSIHGANIRKACSELSWDEQQEEFAKFLLINILALYESWLAKILSDLGLTSRKIEKSLQFPTFIQSDGTKTGVWGAIDDITSVESSMLKNAFYSTLILHRKNSQAKLDNLLLCYRYFKEARNCLVHKGGIADVSAEQAYLAFSAVATPADLGVSEVPNHSVVTINSPIHLSLRGIVGFCDVVLRMIATIDAELSRAESAEKVFHLSWLNKHGKKYVLKRPGKAARQAQIERLVQRLGYPAPSTTTAIEKYLLDNDLAR